MRPPPATLRLCALPVLVDALVTAGCTTPPADRQAAGAGGAPFSELAARGRLAAENDGCLLVGIAELEGETFYNSGLIYGPEGPIGVHRKRALPFWNVAGLWVAVANRRGASRQRSLKTRGRG